MVVLYWYKTYQLVFFFPSHKPVVQHAKAGMAEPCLRQGGGWASREPRAVPVGEATRSLSPRRRWGLCDGQRQQPSEQIAARSLALSTDEDGKR